MSDQLPGEPAWLREVCNIVGCEPLPPGRRPGHHWHLPDGGRLAMYGGFLPEMVEYTGEVTVQALAGKYDMARPVRAVLAARDAYNAAMRGVA